MTFTNSSLRKIIHKPLKTTSCNFTGKGIITVKNKSYFVDDTVSADGDNPKEFIRVYHPEKKINKRRGNKSNYTLHLAKTAEKNYPVESYSEFLIGRIGECFGFDVAKVRVRMISGQVRLLSEYFLDPEVQYLVSGAQILFYKYGRKFITEIQKEKKVKEMIILSDIEESIKYNYPNQYSEILSAYVKMLLFDALIGNNDRHHYNWSVIESVDDSHIPYFSPIYDTARGLFWNIRQEKIVFLANEFKNNRFLGLNKYLGNSNPKVCYKGDLSTNHISLISYIINNNYYLTKVEARKYINQSNLDKAIELIEENAFMITKERALVIRTLLQKRYEILENIL